MPYFDYSCNACGQTKEFRTKGEQEHFDFCSDCEQQTYFSKKLSAPIGFILKGNGFYRPSPSK